MGRVRRALLDELVGYDEAAELRQLETRLLELARRAQNSPPAGDELTDVRELRPLMTAEERQSLVSPVLETVVLDMDRTRWSASARMKISSPCSAALLERGS